MRDVTCACFWYERLLLVIIGIENKNAGIWKSVQKYIENHWKNGILYCINRRKNIQMVRENKYYERSQSKNIP